MSKIKGIGLRGAIEWIKKNYGEEGFQKVLDISPPSLKEEYSNILTSLWYPSQIADSLFAAFAESGLGGHGLDLDKSFRLLGAFIAEDNLSVLYKVLLVFAKPSVLLGSLPKIWKMYFDGIDVAVEPTSDGYTGTCRVKGLGDLRYISPVAAGWLEFLYRKVGVKGIDVHELNYRIDSPSNDELIYKIWRK